MLPPAPCPAKHIDCCEKCRSPRAAPDETEAGGVASMFDAPAATPRRGLAVSVASAVHECLQPDRLHTQPPLRPPQCPVGLGDPEE